MKSWIVSYADGPFLLSQKVLMESALRYGVEDICLWDRAALEQSILYKMHQPILDVPRGGGYWLWKPFIIKEALKKIDTGDIIIYSDAGIEFIEDVSPLLNLCLRKKMLIFAGHYDDVGSLGPNICSKWTKRDCFVFMDCDKPCYYKSRMVDASFLVLVKTKKTIAFICEWLLYCCQTQLLTDQPNICGYPNLPDFIEHRHDQSILSLLAARDKIELFRHPSQFGNHLKDKLYRQQGEWKSRSYSVNDVYYNSPYKTLLNHHRGNLDRKDIFLISIRRTIPAPQEKVFYTWTDPEELMKWLRPLGYLVVSSESYLEPGGRYHLALMNLQDERMYDIKGEYLEIDPPKRLVYSWPWSTRITVEFHNQGDSTDVELIHEFFTNEKVRYGHLMGWNASLDRLAEILSSFYYSGFRLNE